MKISRDIVQTGTNSIAGYTIDGVLRQAAPIDHVILFVSKLPGLTERVLDISGVGFPIQPLTMWAKFTPTSGNSLEFTVKDPITSSVIFKEIISAFPYTFPFLILRPEGIVTIKGVTELEEVWVWGKPVDILDIRSF
jgi:hypothetical protein